ncbi:hypothetical protein ERO13_D11G090701v2 [Gossypium hirsutum]|nr:hypothetical protein ERO13_D11G090701v2 [Gossypium hirsutum]
MADDDMKLQQPVDENNVPDTPEPETEDPIPTPPVSPACRDIWREQRWKDILSKEERTQRCSRCQEIGHAHIHCPYPFYPVKAIFNRSISRANGLETSKREIPMQSLWSTRTQPPHLSWTCFLLNRLFVCVFCHAELLDIFVCRAFLWCFSFKPLRQGIFISVVEIDIYRRFLVINMHLRNITHDAGNSMEHEIYHHNGGTFWQLFHKV